MIVALAAEPWNAGATSESRGTAPALIGGVCSDSPTCSFATQLRNASTTKLSMIVTITSLARNRALSAPGMHQLRRRPGGGKHTERPARIAGVPAGIRILPSPAANPPQLSLRADIEHPARNLTRRRVR